MLCSLSNVLRVSAGFHSFEFEEAGLLATPYNFHLYLSHELWRPTSSTSLQRHTTAAAIMNSTTPNLAMATTSNDDTPSVSGVEIEAGIKIDKTTIRWLSVVFSLATVGIIIAFVVLGHRFCCGRKKRKGKTDCLDNRNVFGAWSGEKPLPPEPAILSQPKEHSQTTGRGWEITIPPVVVVDEAPPSSPRGKDRRYRQSRCSTWNRTMRSSFGQRVSWTI